jgi:hypothetical protein
MKTKVGIILYLGEIVQDMWESEDPKEALRNFTARTVGKVGWKQGLGDFKATAYVMRERDAVGFAFTLRDVPITIDTPPKCKNPRPCAEGADLLAWFVAKQVEALTVEAEPSPVEAQAEPAPVQAEPAPVQAEPAPVQAEPASVRAAVVHDFTTKKGVRAYWAAQRGTRRTGAAV